MWGILLFMMSKCENWFKMYNIDSADTLYDAWLFTGMAVNLAHSVDIGKVLEVMEASDCYTPIC